jgi:tRNA pseudouridine(38-40) synthase
VAVSCKALVDATGNGKAAQLAGNDVMIGNDEHVSQPVTTLCRIAGVDIDALKDYVRQHPDDFKSFCGNPKMKKSTVRLVDSIEICRKGGYVILDFHGTGFLQNMVRILTGTLLEVGYGKMEPEQMIQILEAKERAAAGPTAPPQGLSLIRVDY